MSDFITKQITYFEKSGIINTDKAIELVVQRAREGDIKKIIVASSSGKTGLKTFNALEKNIQVTPVLLSAGSKYENSIELKNNKKEFEKLGIKYVQGILAFSGVERAIKEKWDTVGPAMLMSDALRISGDGFRVGIEIALMATDAGFTSPDENIITIAGTSSGADTALVVKPAYSNKFFEFAVREIICKPFTEGVKHEAR